MANVFVSTIVGAPAAEVWSIIRDFNGLPAWTPFVADSRIEQNFPADQVGCVRSFRLKDGGVIRERLLALSDYDFSMTYSILESPMGVEDYIATLRLMPVTDGNRTYAEWSAEFRCPPEREAALVGEIGGKVFGEKRDVQRPPSRNSRALGCASTAPNFDLPSRGRLSPRATHSFAR